jgi:hypothetical protein
MSLIYDNNALVDVKLDPLPNLIIDQVVVWHEYDVSTLHVSLLVIEWAHLLFLIESAQFFDS